MPDPPTPPPPPLPPKKKEKKEGISFSSYIVESVGTQKKKKQLETQPLAHLMDDC